MDGVRGRVVIAAWGAEEFYEWNGRAWAGLNLVACGMIAAAVCLSNTIAEFWILNVFHDFSTRTQETSLAST